MSGAPMIEYAGVGFVIFQLEMTVVGRTLRSLLSSFLNRFLWQLPLSIIMSDIMRITKATLRFMLSLENGIIDPISLLFIPEIEFGDQT